MPTAATVWLPDLRLKYGENQGGVAIMEDRRTGQKWGNCEFCDLL